MKTRLLIILLALSTLSLPTHAVDVGGVPIAPTAEVSANGPALTLNGSGVRKKFFMSVYVGALYLPAKAVTPQEVFAQPGPKRMLLHFVYDELSAQKLVDAWNEGFAANTSDAELAALRTRIGQFNALFVTTRKGDVIALDYLPGEGTRVSHNGQAKGTIPGEDFNKALLKIWLGDKPVTEELKKALLGG
ncbi:MAG: chalcone isomerase family protein [Gammaproteobacteria bacterium]|nr:chalcone isomerase family protein [Gammaproteobacteria bacterium]